MIDYILRRIDIVNLQGTANNCSMFLSRDVPTARYGKIPLDALTTLIRLVASGERLHEILDAGEYGKAGMYISFTSKDNQLFAYYKCTLTTQGILDELCHISKKPILSEEKNIYDDDTTISTVQSVEVSGNEIQHVLGNVTDDEQEGLVDFLPNIKEMYSNGKSVLLNALNFGKYIKEYFLNEFRIVHGERAFNYMSLWNMLEDIESEYGIDTLYSVDILNKILPHLDLGIDEIDSSFFDIIKNGVRFELCQVGAGATKLMYLLPILIHGLKEGKIVLVDDFCDHLHPVLVDALKEKLFLKIWEKAKESGKLPGLIVNLVRTSI